MPSIEAYKQYLIRTDYGLLFLVIATTLCVVLTIVLWRRWAGFRRLALLVWPLLTLWAFVVNPLFAGVSATWPLAYYFDKFTRRLTLPPILIGALLLRLPLMFMSFWYDEAFTARLATLLLNQLWPAIQADTHPPVFYSVIWLWSKVAGQSEFMLRLPSLAFGMLSMYLLYRLVKAAGLSARVALIAALLCAITPSAIYYSTELRSYSMLVCAVFGSMICILEDRPRGFIVCTALVAWLHNLGLLYVPVLLLIALTHLGHKWRYVTISRQYFAVARRDIFLIRVWLFAVGCAALLSLIWLPLTIQQSHTISDGFWIYFDAGTPLWTLTLNLMYLPREYILPIMLPYIALTGLTFWIARLWLLSHAGRLLLMLMLAVPAIGVLISLAWAPVYLPRVFLPLTLLALIPLAYALHTRARIVAPVAAPILIASLLVFYSTANLIRPDYRSMVAEGCAGSTAVYYTAIDTAITIAPDTELPALVWPGSSDRGDTFMPGQLALFNFKAGEISDFNGQTVCLVYIFTPRTLDSEREKIAKLLAQYPHTSREYHLHSELQVDLYQVKVS